MGGVRRPRRDKHNDGGFPVKFQKGSHSLFGTTPKCHYQGSRFMSAGVFYPEVAGDGCGAGNHHSATSFLLSAVHPGKEKWQTPTGYRPLGTQRSSSGTNVQDGDGFRYLPFNLGDSLGVLHRHRRRLFSCTDGLGLSQVLRLPPQGKNIRFPVSPIWPLAGPVDVLSSHKTNKTTSSLSPDSNLQFPGRLYPVRPVSGGASREDNCGPGVSSSSWLQGELGKVEPPSFSVDRIPGGHLGSTEERIIRSPGQTGHAQVPMLGNVSEGCRHQEGGGEFDGHDELCRDLYSSGKAPSSAHSDVVESPHPPLHQGRACSSRGESEGAAGSLDVSGFPEPASSNACSYTVSHLDDGCLLGGLVRDPSTAEGHGVLAGKCVSFFDELEGAKGCIVSSEGIPGSSQGEDCASSLGQHDGRVVPETTGLCEAHAPSFPDVGDFSVLQEQVDRFAPRTPKGSVKCISGPGFAASSHCDRMVAGQSDIQLDLPPGSPPPGGFICHTGKRTAQGIRLSVSGQSGGSIRCVQPRLESLDMYLPDAARELHGGGGITPSGISGFGCSDSSLLAVEGMVPVASPTVHEGPPSSAGRPPVVPNDFEGFGNPQRPWLLAASRVAALNAPWVSRGLSDDSAGIVRNAHRGSTQRNYQAVWNKFLGFLAINKIPHKDVSVYVVMNFLSHQFIHFGRAYRTVAAYKCALAHPLWTNFGIPLGDASLDLFMRGIFNLDPPRPAPMPTWSLDTLLEFLLCDHFEPLHSKDLLRVTQKTLCLLLLATGRRIDEIAHLSKFHVFRQDGEAVTVHWLPRYVPKHFDRSFQPILPSFERLASDADGDLLLCPVRAFNTYLGMVRGGPRYSVNSPLWSLDGKGLSGLFKSTVLQARLRAGLSEVVSIGPHHMRKLAASYSARMIGSSPEGERKLMDRMGCASMNVLKRTYINNVPLLSFKVVLPAGTFVPDTEVCVI